MADNFNVSEWRFNRLLKEGFDEQAHDLVLDTTEQIKKEFNSLSDEAQEYYAKTLVDNLNQMFEFVLESKKKVDEELDPEDQVVELTDEDIRKIVDTIESETPYNDREGKYYDEDGIVFGAIADYAMDSVPENKVFYASIQELINAFEDIVGETLVVTKHSSGQLDEKHEFAGGIGYTYDSLEEGKICDKGKAWAKRTFDTYPSAYANMAASKYCKDPNYAKE